MTDSVEDLILDVLDWVGRKERTYPETMDAWRTSCPTFPVWEDATDRRAGGDDFREWPFTGSRNSGGPRSRQGKSVPVPTSSNTGTKNARTR
jgi:hypothetical protein